jgi:starvation-inducible DNA-binding protein
MKTKTAATLPLRATASALGSQPADEIACALNVLLADLFALYIKTKSFHWHVSGPHFRDYHLLLDEQAAQILATTDLAAERVRKIGRTTLRSIGHIAGLQRVSDCDDAAASARDMLAELHVDNAELADNLRRAHALCDEHGDIATASLIENWVDEAEQRAWVLRETIRAEG